MKKIILLVNTVLFSYQALAVDYVTPISGPKTFEDGDNVTVITGSSTAVSDTTSGGAGIHVNNNGAISISADVNVTTALHLGNNVANDLGSGSSVTTKSSEYSTAIDVTGSGTSLTATDLAVSAGASSSGYGVVAINIDDGASVNLKGNTTITATGTGVKLVQTQNVTAHFSADRAIIEVNGSNATGIRTDANTTVDLGSGSIIQTTGFGAVGIVNFGGHLIAKDLTVINDSAAGSMKDAMDIRGTADIDGGSITAINSNGVSVEGGTLNYKNGSISTSNNAPYTHVLVTQNVNSTANLDNVELTLNGFGYAMWATGGGGRVNANNVTINTDEGYGVFASVQGKVTFTGNTFINAGASDVAMLADDEGSQIITGLGGSKMNIQGSLFANAKGLIDLHMQQDSYLNGAVSTEDNGTTKLNMIGTQWDMTADSKVTELTAADTYINFMSSQDNYQTLQIGKLTGNKTTYNMNVDLGSITTAPNAQGERIGQAGVNGDLIKVTEAVNAGSNTLIIANNGAANTQGNEVLQVVQTPNNNIGNFTLPVPVEAGAYEYKLRQSQDSSKNKTGWELYTPSRRTTTAEAATSFLNSNYLLSYIDTQTLLQRMGQLREGTNPQGDFWIRGFGGKLSSFGGQQLSGFDMTYTGTQLGIDKQLTTQLGQAYIGIMGGMTHANPDYRDGDGTTKDYHVGLYGTLMMDNGVYVDAVAKYTYMKNHFSVKDTQGNSVQGKGTSNGYNVSLETGKRFKLAAADQSGLYLEPQAQITYGHQSGMSINASNGLKVQLGNYNYTLGRLSTIIGYQIAGANPVNLYLKTGYVREMDGSTSYKLNNQKSTYNARGGWWDNGIGINAQINKSHNIYADINYAKGSRFDQKQLNLGYRYAF